MSMDERWIWAAAAVGAGLLLGAFLALVIRRSLDREERRRALREISGPLSVFVFWIVTAAGIVTAVAVSSPDTLEPIPADILAWLPDAALAGLLLIAGYALGLTLATAVGRAVARASGQRHRPFEQIVRSAVFAGAVILALSQIGVDTTILNILIAAVAFGVTGALAGIAVVGVRSVAPDVAAGRNLQRVLDVGTRIRVGAIEGVIAELQISHAVLETDDGRLLVPYSRIAPEPILTLADD